MCCFFHEICKGTWILLWELSFLPECSPGKSKMCLLEESLQNLLNCFCHKNCISPKTVCPTMLYEVCVLCFFPLGLLHISNGRLTSGRYVSYCTNWLLPYTTDIGTLSFCFSMISGLQCDCTGLWCNCCVLSSFGVGSLLYIFPHSGASVEYPLALLVR